MSKIPLVMNLVSGLLLAYDLLPKSGKLLEIHNKLKKAIREIDEKDITQRRTLFFAMLVSLFVFAVFLCYVYYKVKNSPNEQVLIEIVSFFTGSLIAFLIVAGLATMTRSPFYTLLGGFVLSISSLILFGVIKVLPNPLMAGLAAFVIMSLLHPTALASVGYVKKALLANPEREYYMFGALGLMIFISSTLIQIAVDP